MRNRKVQPDGLAQIKIGRNLLPPAELFWGVKVPALQAGGREECDCAWGDAPRYGIPGFQPGGWGILNLSNRLNSNPTNTDRWL